MSVASSIDIRIDSHYGSVTRILQILTSAGWGAIIDGEIRYLINTDDDAFEWSMTTSDSEADIITQLEVAHQAGTIVGIMLQWQDSEMLIDVLWHSDHSVSFVLAGVRVLLKGSEWHTDVSWYLERLLIPLVQASLPKVTIESVKWSEHV